MNYIEKKIKEQIREGIWSGMLLTANIHERENPYRALEFLEQQTENLNFLTNKTYSEIQKYLEVTNGL